MKRWTFVIVTLLVSVGAGAAESYSVEDAIRHEWVGPVHFTPDGAGLAIQHAKAANESYGMKSQIFWTDLRNGGDGHALFPPAQAEGYTWFWPSPDSRYAAYFHYHGDLLNMAVYDFRARRSTEFDVVPDGVPYLIWISDHEVAFSTISPGTAESSFIGQLSVQWQRMQEGRSATASAMGSGRHAARPDEDGGEGIVILDVKSGIIRSIGRGRFLDQAISPSGTRLAAIRRLPAVLNPLLPMQDGVERGPLVVFDINREGAQLAIRDSADVVPGSLLWSPSGRRFAFLTEGDKGSRDQTQLWTYDTQSGVVDRVELAGLSLLLPKTLLPTSAWRRTTAFTWLGEELAVRAQAAPSRETHAGWFLLRSGAAPTNLTAEFDQAPEIVAITRDSLLMSADGQVWEIRANRRRRLLTGRLGQRVRVIHGETTFQDPINLPTSNLLLEEEQSLTPKTIYFLDVASGRVTGRIKAPTTDAKIKAVSVAAKRAAFLYRRNNVDIVSVGEANGASRDILRCNEFERDKEIGTFIKIEHAGSKSGEKLISWLLLPPGYRNGSPLPAVVHIYPGIAYDAVPPRLNPTDATLLLAAHGYAVLFASLPVDTSVFPREPLQGLAEAVLHAVDAAIAQGYIDGNHLAVQGQSYGGGGTLGVIGQTDRFKAAVSVAGVFDLISMYGHPRMYDRFAAEFDGIDMAFPIGWVETGPPGMGVPPWDDSQRYLRNSPLLHVGTINTPVMLVHGDLDSTAPFTQAEEMFTALYRLNKDAEFVRYWGEGHHVPVSPANIRDYWTRVYAWYDAHIGPPFDVAKALSSGAASDPLTPH